MTTTLDDREIQKNISWTSKIANASVLRRAKRPRQTFELMKRGHLRPRGISRPNMIYVRMHAARMIKIYKRYDRIAMTSEEREKFEAAVLEHKGRQPSESFALVTINIQRVESKVDNVLQILNDRLPPNP